MITAYTVELIDKNKEEAIGKYDSSIIPAVGDYLGYKNAIWLVTERMITPIERVVTLACTFVDNNK